MDAGSELSVISNFFFMSESSPGRCRARCLISVVSRATKAWRLASSVSSQWLRTVRRENRADIRRESRWRELAKIRRAVRSAAYRWTNDLGRAYHVPEALESFILGVNDRVSSTGKALFGGMKN